MRGLFSPCALQVRDMIETQNFSLANFDEEMRHFFHSSWFGSQIQLDRRIGRSTSKLKVFSRRSARNRTSSGSSSSSSRRRGSRSPASPPASYDV